MKGTTALHPAGTEVLRTFSAMASTVSVRLLNPRSDSSQALDEVESLFARVESTCTRFNPDSDLMRANAAAKKWCEVSPTCSAVIAEAFSAYQRTHGRFDPRVLPALQALGYDRTWTRMPADTTPSAAHPRPVPRRAWQPRFDLAGARVKVGSTPIDLGGIGKGYAVREALELLRGHAESALVSAGGDLATFGPGPRGDRWLVSVDDPTCGQEPVAVLGIADTSVATSSVQRRRWHRDGQVVHHLIDPRTGTSADSGLHGVTVVHPDNAVAETLTKTGFLAGHRNIRRLMDEQQIPAVWVTADGRVRFSAAARNLVEWNVNRVPGK